MGLQLRERAQLGEDRAVVGAAVRTLTVDGHAARDHHLLEPVADRAVVHRDVEDSRAAHGVDVGVAPDVVHALGHTDEGGLMDQDVDTVQGVSDGLGIPDVAQHQLGFTCEVVWPPTVLAQSPVDLRLEIVEDPDRVASPEEFVSDVTADESGAAGDQCRAHACHRLPRL